MNGVESLIKALQDVGTKTVFGYPGGQALPLYDVLYDASIQHILVRHEQTASHAADGYARASGELGVCISTSGPGATNLITGIATAKMDSSPVLAITAQVPTTQIGNDAFQEVDTLGITMPITKYQFQPLKSEELAATIKSAHYIATTGRPGPVVIDLPKDVQTGEVESYKFECLNLKGYKPSEKPHTRQIKRAIKLIQNSEKPIILAGGGTIISNATHELEKFAKLINAPVCTTLMGKGILDENEDYVMGMLGMHGQLVANQSTTETDCLIAIGCRFSDRTTGDINEFAKNAKIIHADIDPAEIGKNIDVDIPIVGDAKKTLKSFIQILEKTPTPTNNNTYLNYIKEFKKTHTPQLKYDNTPLKPQQIIHEITQAIDTDTILTTDVGQNQMWMAHLYHTNKPRKFISSGGLGTMGFGFPAAIGAKAACPENNVLSITGDGGFLMVCQDLITIREYDLPMVICLFNNQKLGMVSQWQELFYNNRLSYTNIEQAPDFVKLAESFKINAERITQPGETETAIKKAFKTGEPTLLDIELDKTELLPMVPPGDPIDNMIGNMDFQ